MEEQKPRIQSSLPLHHPLARQLYSDEYGSASVVESNVVPLPTQNTITEDERLSHNASKRKQRSGTEGKTRAATGSKKTFKTVRQSQSAPPYQYADEVKRLEDHAKRINQILADCAHKEASREPLAELSTRITETADVIPNSIDSPNLIKHSSTQSQTSTSSVERQVTQQSPHIQSCKNQWHSSTPIQKQTVETLKTQNYGVHQRLIELGLHLNEASRLVPSSETLSDSKQVNFPQGQSPVPPAPIPSPVHHSPIQWEETPKQLGDEKPLHTAKTESFPHWNQGISTNRKRPGDRDPLRSRSFPPAILRRYLREGYKRLSNGRSLKLPRQPINRISDAALWIATFAIVRVAFRYGVAAFPMLSPIFLMLMLAPAIAAVYLVFCVPKAGWLPYYRLFLMMVGFLVGGKL